MDVQEFEREVDEQYEWCMNILKKKGLEYGRCDRLHNFKIAAKLMGVNPKHALAGMMVKHIVSVYDMCMDDHTRYSRAMWEEKIGDTINYLFLLKSLLIEIGEISMFCQTGNQNPEQDGCVPKICDNCKTVNPDKVHDILTENTKQEAEELKAGYETALEVNFKTVKDKAGNIVSRECWD